MMRKSARPATSGKPCCPPSRGLSCALLGLALLLAHLTAANAATTLRFVQVVHRHGSRTPTVSYNESLICGDVPCGYLNVPGQTMLVNAGKALRSRYNDDATVVSAPLFPSEQYDLDVSYSRSTDSLRTLQSADGLLRGLFPNMTAFYPALHTVDKPTDKLLTAEVFPFPYAFYNLDKEIKHVVCNPWVDAVMTFETIKAIAKEVHSEGFCADVSKRCECVDMLYDIGAAMAADGRIASRPLLQTNLAKLRNINERYWAYEFGYNASDERSIKMGSQGQPLAQQVLTNAQLHMQGKLNYKLYHYSGHDTTLAPLAATLRDESPVGVRPPFAQLYAFELLYDDVANAYSMRVLRGYPGQTPETGYAFSWETDFQLKCMSSNGEMYNAANNTCPFDDFQRLVDSSKPKDAAGLCYIDDDYKKLFACPAEEGGSLTSACQAFRKVCPAVSCASGLTLDTVTLQCKCSDASCIMKDHGVTGTGVRDVEDTMSPGSAVSIAIATFAFGLLISSIIMIVAVKMRSGSKADK